MTEKRYVLVIEDEPSVADTITYALETEGFNPVWCATGRDGLQALPSRPVHLVILDVGLPDMSGFDLCREIRKTSNVPVIFLTARADEIDRVVGLELGGDDYMVKPFSPRELTARVKAVLRRAGRESNQDDRPPDPVATSFEIDSDRFLIRYRGVALSLTRYEFRILDILVRHPGRVYSREVLMNQAWEEPEASMDRTVDAHIKSLRAKLRAVKASKDLIKTHRGLGYSFSEDA